PAYILLSGPRAGREQIPGCSALLCAEEGPGRGKPWSHDKSGTYDAGPSTLVARASVVAYLSPRQDALAVARLLCTKMHCTPDAPALYLPGRMRYNVLTLVILQSQCHFPGTQPASIAGVLPNKQ